MGIVDGVDVGRYVGCIVDGVDVGVTELGGAEGAAVGAKLRVIVRLCIEKES